MSELLKPGAKVEVLANEINLHQKKQSYIILKKLHEGKQGEVYRVNDPRVAVMWDSPPGLKNVSNDNWTCRNETGQLVIIPPGESVSLQSPRAVNFGRVVGEIKI
jgi:hypothetical protein